MAEKRKFTIPSIDQIEQVRQTKRTTSFFKPKSNNASSNNSSPTATTVEKSTTPAAQSSSPSSTSLNALPAPKTSVTSQSSTTATSNTSAPPTRPATTTFTPPAARTATPTTNRPTSQSPSTQNNHNSNNAAVQPPVNRRTGSGNTILVNYSRQKENPILKLVHNVPWEPDDVIRCDFAVGKTTGVWYLSLRYHRLNPGYIYDRIAGVARTYVLRVLLVHVDVENYHEPLRELNRSAILHNFTLMLAWTKEEAARYLETYKVLENTPPDMIREKSKEDYAETLERCLTNVRSVNKTDVLTLRSHFHSLKGIANARADQLAMCPGFGEQKVKRLQQAFVQPFIIKQKKK